MQNISSKKFDLQFFLSNMVKVTDIISGAKEHGGATRNTQTGEIWSNVEGDEFIQVTNKNTVSIFLPTTMNVDQNASEEKIFSTLHKIHKKMNKISKTAINNNSAIGSWYSDDLQKVVTENIIMITQSVENLTEKDIANYVKIAKMVKKSMKQECVSLKINSSLLLA